MFITGRAKTENGKSGVNPFLSSSAAEAAGADRQGSRGPQGVWILDARASAGEVEEN